MNITTHKRDIAAFRKGKRFEASISTVESGAFALILEEGFNIEVWGVLPYRDNPPSDTLCHRKTRCPPPTVHSTGCPITIVASRRTGIWYKSLSFTAAPPIDERNSEGGFRSGEKVLRR